MKFLHHLRACIVEYVSEYIFFVSNKKTHTHTHKKQKKVKKIEKQKIPKKKRRKKMLLPKSVEKQTAYIDIV